MTDELVDPPRPRLRSAEDIFLEDGDFGPAQQIIDQYIAELRLGRPLRRNHHRRPDPGAHFQPERPPG